MDLTRFTAEELATLHAQVDKEIYRRYEEDVQTKREKVQSLQDDPAFQSLSEDVDQLYEGRDLEIPLHVKLNLAAYIFPDKGFNEPFEMVADDIGITLVGEGGAIIETFDPGLMNSNAFLDLPEVQAAMERAKKQLEEEIQNKDIHGRVYFLAQSHDISEEEVWENLM